MVRLAGGGSRQRYGAQHTGCDFGLFDMAARFLKVRDVS